jgi:hypothetical protein
LTEVNEAIEKQTTHAKKKNLTRQHHLPSPMPPKFPPPQLTIGTRAQNKNAHPGKPVVDARQSRRSKQQMQEVRAQEAQQAVEDKARLANGLKLVAQIEDELLQEDVQRRTSNHQSQGIMPFNPHLQVMGSDVAATGTGHQHTECGLSSLITVGKLILTLLGDGDTAHNAIDRAMGSDVAAPGTGHKRTKLCGLLSLTSIIRKKYLLYHPRDNIVHNITDDEEGSEGSQDEFRPPPPCEDGEDSVSDGESEAPDESEKEATKKPGARKGKKPKPG